MENKKLNTFTLSGLIIGPVLGSGVILLPPLVFNTIGDFSFFLWIIISLLGFFFALIFGKLATLYPGDGGVSLATKSALGKKYQLLTSFYLICAVFFGPVAVVLIAAKFLQPYFPTSHIVTIAIPIYILIYTLLLTKIDFIGKMMLVVTSFITLLFLISSIAVLYHTQNYTFSFPIFDLQNIGYSFLIAFWAIVGWEVIGNYSKDTQDTKTITRSIIISAIVISLVYILVSLAIIFGDFTNKTTQEFQLVWLLEPIFKSYATHILATTTLLLCIGTLLLFVGGVARLISSLKLTSFTSKRLTKTNAPIGSLNFLATIHIVVLSLVYLDYFTIDKLIAFADGFFIANAIIGLVTAIILFNNGILKYSAYLLIVLFTAILLFSNIFILLVIFGLFLYTYLKKGI